LGTAAKAKKSRSIPLWLRLTPLQRALVIIAIAAAVVLPRIDKLVEPFARGFALAEQIVESQRELKLLNEQHESLTARMKQLKTTEGLKLEIRESLGQVGPREYPLQVIVQPPAPKEPRRPAAFMKAQGLDIDTAAFAVRDTVTRAIEILLKWAGLDRSKG